MPDLTVHTRPFDFSRGVPEYTGDRGVVVEAETGFASGRVFARRMPDVYVTENGEVEFDDLRVPVATFREWAAAVLDVVEAL